MEDSAVKVDDGDNEGDEGVNIRSDIQQVRLYNRLIYCHCIIK
jgi:hypothetical protein